MATATMTVAPSPPASSGGFPGTGTGSTAGRVVLNVCPDGHLLINKVVTGGLFGFNLKHCVRCNGHLKTGTSRHSCKLCGFHLCDTCWALWMSREAPRTLLTSGSCYSAAVATPSTRSPATRPSSSASLVPPKPIVTPACKYGACCYQKSAWHLQQFVHPGDRHYRIGQVSFSNGQYPEFQNLWQLFQYHDREESGHLDKEEFLQALESCHRLLKSDLPMEAQEAWSQAGGPCTGFVNFSQFAHLAETLGLALPVGLELDGATRPCRFRVRLKNNGDFGQEEYTCSCPCFQAERAGGGVLCQCGHKLSMHRSDFAEDTYANIDSHLRAPSPQRGIWMPGEEGLVAVTDQDLLRKLQDLMNDSHKSHDNWTRDRGCRLHGVNGCSWACAAKNRNPVPSGFTLQAAYRNQSPELWRRYCLLKQAIRLECARNQGGEFPQPKLLSAADLDSGLDKDCNEWRCFHGSRPEKLRGICETNFRPALAGTGATWKDAGTSKGTPLYGFGFYFAERITKADEYSQPLPEGDEHEDLYTVLVCRVVGGRTKVVTNNDIDVDGLRGSVFDGPYHSVFGDRVTTLGKPYREVVVYDKDQCYPEFLLLYRREFS